MFDMLGNIIRNAFSKPATRVYPHEKRTPFVGTRGKVGINIENCIFCSICARKCPSDAITVDRAGKSWEIDPFKCVICGVCEEVCPKKAIAMDENYKNAAYCKDKTKHVQETKPEKEAGQETA